MGRHSEGKMTRRACNRREEEKVLMGIKQASG